MGLCSHRKETSSIVCLGNLRRLTSKFFVGIGLMWNFKFDGSLFVSVSKRPGSQGVSSYLFRSRCKAQPLAFMDWLCAVLLLGTVIFSLACGWGTILGWGFCIVEYSPDYRYVFDIRKRRLSCFLKPWILEYDSGMLRFMPKSDIPFDFFIYIFKVFCPPWDSFEALFPWYFVW